MQSHAPISPTSTLPLIKWREWKLKFLFFTHITLHTLSTVCILCFLYIFIHHARWRLWFSCVFQCPLSCRLFPGRLHSVRHYRIPWGVWTYCLICITTSVQCWRKDFFFFLKWIYKNLSALPPLTGLKHLCCSYPCWSDTEWNRRRLYFAESCRTGLLCRLHQEWHHYTTVSSCVSI